nr:MAG TPA: hypothetical protein [Caudoviricetes sp.]
MNTGKGGQTAPGEMCYIIISKKTGRAGAFTGLV